MAKKKLSRDQKRKQKKQKRKQRKQKNVSAGPNWSNLKINQMTPEEQEAQIAEGQARYAEQKQRIKAVFGLPEIPEVNASTLLTYFNYIGDKLIVPCRLTGIESMGYFGWEERYSFGYGSKADYQRLRKEQASFKDEYELKDFDAVLDAEWDILVEVKRTSDGKCFTIPLSELQAVDETSAQYQLLNDYTVWYVNWR